MSCTCPKWTVNDVVQTAALDVFCPTHGRPPTSGCEGCRERDVRIADLEGKLAAHESIVRAAVGTP